MTNLIYQYWDGPMTSGAQSGSDAMKEYALRIGADYLFEHNAKFRTDLGTYSPHYGQFKIVYEPTFEKYDNILYADTDVFPIENLSENIFENFSGDVGICTEEYQPKARLDSMNHINSKNDERWAAAIKKKWNVEMPRTKEGLLKVYNSGMVLYSKKGITKMRKNFVPFTQYVHYILTSNLPDFYASDQGFLHAMLKVASLDYIEMDNGWNSYVHYIGDPNISPRPINDLRTNNTKFVHIQLRGADHYDNKKLWRITNLPVEQWEL